MSAELATARLAFIIEVIARLNRRSRPLTLVQMISDIDELDLAAYRLALIGETANKLPAAVKERYPQIGWAAMYVMRNIISHDYGSIDPVRVWQTVQEFLDPLEAVCREEIAHAGGA